MAGRLDYPVVFLLGDSLFQEAVLMQDGFSFQRALEEHCARRLDVINRGFSGYNTNLLLDILDNVLPDPSCVKIEYFLLLIGANDACVPDAESGQHVPLSTYTASLKRILTHPRLLAHQPRKILIVTPPPCNEHQRPNGHRLAAVTSQYAEAARQVALSLGGAAAKGQDGIPDAAAGPSMTTSSTSSKTQYILIDLYRAMMQAAAANPHGETKSSGKALPLQSDKHDEVLGSINLTPCSELASMLSDGLHLTAKTYRLLFDLVRVHIGPEWAGEQETATSWVYPHWSLALQQLAAKKSKS